MSNSLINIKNIVVGKWKVNCYIVSDSKKSIIIDPGANANHIIDFIKIHQLNVLAILNTHAHYDHVGAVSKIQVELSIPFYLHSKDIMLLKSVNLYQKIFNGDSLISIPKVNYYFDKINLPLKLGKLSIQIIHTPGHTEGGVCFRIGDYLFTGDTLLKGNIGRVDLPGGDRVTLNNSLRIISKFPDYLVIHPGHDESTILGEELKNNSKLKMIIQ